MSFYLSYAPNLQYRKTPHVFYFKDACLYSIHDQENKLLDVSNVNNPIIEAFHFILNKNISDFELAISVKDDVYLLEACEEISRYLLDKENSIGLLFANPDFHHEYRYLIDKYGINYSTSKIKNKPNYEVEDVDVVKREKRSIFVKARLNAFKPMTSASIDDDLESGLVLDKPFNEVFIGLLNESGKDNVEVYVKGGISRQVFSKVFSTKDFIPKKETVICLIIGMELNLKDALTLLNSAGYTLSKSIVLDAVILKYLRKGIYDLNIINDELDERGCQLLGWKPRD